MRAMADCLYLLLYLYIIFSSVAFTIASVWFVVALLLEHRRDKD